MENYEPNLPSLDYIPSPTHPDISIPLPPKTHPRLFIRKEHIPGIKHNILAGITKEAYEQMLNHSYEDADGCLPQADENGNDSREVQRSITGKALRYIFWDDTEAGKSAVQMMSNYFDTVVFSTVYTDVHRDVGQVMTTAAIVYDWCYPFLDTPMKQKFIKKLKEYSLKMEISYPPLSTTAVTGHAGEAKLMRDMLSAGIAIYDEDESMYMMCADCILSEYINPRNFFYSGHSHYQGDSYGPGRFSFDMTAAYIFKRLGAGDIFSSEQGQVLYRYLYDRRPDGKLMRDGDSFYACTRPYGHYWSYPPAFMYVANYYRDPVIVKEFNKQFKNRRDQIDPLFVVLFNNPYLPERGHDDFPLTRYFGAPIGVMTARTGWEQDVKSGNVVATMQMGGYCSNNHKHLDAGQFQIYYKGFLAIETGIYEGKGADYGSDHDYNYHKRTISHNCMLVYDPNERFVRYSKPIANDGGQKMVADAREPRDMDMLLKNKVAEVLAHDFGPDTNVPDYSHIKGDLTSAYSAKVETYQRSFVFFNLKNDKIPAVLVIFDHICSSDKAFKKTWLLHTFNEPVLTDDTITASRNDFDYNGKMVNTVLLPLKDNSIMQKIGGEGKEAYVDGVNYYAEEANKDRGGEGLGWRVELSPVSGAQDDLFLNVLQVMDNDAACLPLPVRLVENELFVGAGVGGRLVVFSRDGDRVKNDFTLYVPEAADSSDITGVADGKIAVLLTDMEAGEWAVSSADGFTQDIRAAVSKDKYTLYERLTPGSYRFTKLS